MHWDKKNKVRARAFKPKNGESISVDWSELITPIESARPWVDRFGEIRLGQLTASSVWDEGLDLVYDPKPENIAHFVIPGLEADGTLARLHLARACDAKGVLGPFT